jgi:Ferredoxin-like domain in Api92-like protein
MPNHASNILRLIGPTASVLNFINKVAVGPENHFDFNAVFPVPEELNNTTSPARIQTKAEIDALWEDYNLRKRMGENLPYERPFGLGITQEESDELIRKHGFNNWYDWKLANWGTKWGAYDAGEWVVSLIDQTKSGAEISYNTAWSPATAFLINVSKEYPDVIFKHIFSDEEGGASFVGTETIENGVVTYAYEPSWDSPDGIAFRDELGTNSFDKNEEE